MLYRAHDLSPWLILSAFLFFPSTLAQTVSLGGQDYERRGGDWFVLGGGAPAERVEPTRLLVRPMSRAAVAAPALGALGLADAETLIDDLPGGYAVLRVRSAARGFEVAAALAAAPGYEFVGFDVYGERLDAPADDTYYGQQWNLTSGKLDMPRAWALNFGNPRTIVAVIDSGADVVHPDLVPNLWSGVGYDFLDQDGTPEDNAGHGTAVTGIIGARTNNDVGTAGIAGGYGASQGVALMILKDGDASPYISLTADAIRYAADNGATVANVSTGYSANSVLQSAVDYGADAGLLIVASAGNNGGAIRYPAAYPNTVAVGATDQGDTRVSYSSYGSALDVVAPTVVYTTDIQDGAGYNPASSFLCPAPSDPDYCSGFNGTSAAAPHVAAVAGLVRDANSGLTWQQTRDVLRQTADKVPAMGGAAFSVYYGYGRVDAYEAVLDAIYRLPNDYVVASSTTLSNQTFVGKDVWVLPGATLTLNGTTTLAKDGAGRPSNLYVAGTLQGSGTLTSDGGEIFVRPGGVDAYGGTRSLSGSWAYGGRSGNACIMAYENATVKLAANKTHTFSNNAFVASGGGTYELGSAAVLLSTASAGPPRIGPGTRFRLGANARLRFERPVEIAGAWDAPVRVERLNSGQAWDSVELLADGNELRRVELDGGHRNLYLAGRDNEVRTSTIRNAASRSVEVRSGGGGVPGNLDIFDSTVEDGGGIGLYAYEADLYVYQTTVQDHGSVGVYGYYSDVRMSSSRVLRNGTSSGGNGVTIQYSGSFDASFSAVNHIAGNGGNEVYVSNGVARGYMDTGHNVVCDGAGFGTSEWYVYNNGYYELDAARNFWGGPSSSVDPDMFRGWVTYTPADNYPYISVSCPSSVGGGPLAAAEWPGQARPEGEWGPDPTGLRQRIARAREALARGVDTPEGPALVAELYRLVRWNPDVTSAEGAAAMALVDELRHVPDGVTSGPRAALAERAALIAIDDALYRADADRARELIDAHGPEVASEDGRVGLTVARIEVLRREGRPDAALRVLRRAADWLDRDYVALVEADLADEAAAPAAARTLAVVPAEAEALVTGLAAPYPNPASGRVTVPLTLATRGTVAVVAYDALGREVARLADGPFEAGRHALALDGAALPAGVYVLRASVDAAGAPAAAFAGRVTVVR